MTGVLTTENYYFMFDETVEPFHADPAIDIDDERFDRRFPSDQLPNLGRAPIGSWFLSRLAFLTDGRLGFAGDQNADGGSCCLEVHLFTRDRERIAELQLQVDTEIVLFGTFKATVSPPAVVDEFVAALLAEPASVRPVSVKVRDTDGGVTRTYGFDGKRFRGRSNPRID